MGTQKDGHDQSMAELPNREEMTLLQAAGGPCRGLTQELVANGIQPSYVGWVMIGTMAHYSAISAAAERNPLPDGKYKVFPLGTATVIATPPTIGDVKPWEPGARWDLSSNKWELNVCKIT